MSVVVAEKLVNFLPGKVFGNTTCLKCEEETSRLSSMVLFGCYQSFPVTVMYVFISYRMLFEHEVKMTLSG